MSPADDEAARESLLMHGVLDMCVLALLEQRPTHAYGVVERLQAHGFDHVTYGTVYPLTARLRKSGLLDQQLIPSGAGPARNVLTLNATGRTTLHRWSQQWEAATAKTQALLSHSSSPRDGSRADA